MMKTLCLPPPRPLPFLVHHIGSLSALATFFRIFRVARLFRLVKRSKLLLNLFKTFILSLPSLSNVLGILLLFFFIFAVLGMNLFAGVKKAGFVTRIANFDSFGESLLSLFRASTGESYNGMMHELMVAEPNCSGSNCGTTVAGLFFITFIVVIQFVLLNLLVAIILDNFTEINWAHRQKVKHRHFHAFKNEWMKFDQNREMVVGLDDVKHILLKTPQPLGLLVESKLSSNSKRKETVEERDEALAKAQGFVDVLVMEGHLNVIDEHVTYTQTITALALSCVGDFADSHMAESVLDDLATKAAELEAKALKRAEQRGRITTQSVNVHDLMHGGG